ncbi:MAG TPA: ATP-binding protein [Kineosporiaceae bacterium]|nr:ATP-binding protein [Kineosporiaceae bacterium]
MTRGAPGDASRGTGRWTRGRLVQGLAPLTVGLAVAATAMAGVCTWQAREANSLSLATARETALSQAYQDINSAVNREYSAQLRYLSADRAAAAADVSSSVIAQFVEFTRAQADLRAAVERVKSLGGVDDKALATFVLMEDRQYTQNARSVFADVQAGQVARAQRLATTITGPRVDALISRVASAAAAHAQRSRDSMTRLTGGSRWAALAIPVSFGVALLLLSGCWVIVLRLNKAVRYQASALLAEKQLLSTVIESSPYFVYWKDPSGHYLGANRAFERLRSHSGANRTGATAQAQVTDAAEPDPAPAAPAVPAPRPPESRQPSDPAPAAPDPQSSAEAVRERPAGSRDLFGLLSDLEQEVQTTGVAAMDQQAAVRSADGGERRLLFSVLPRPGQHTPEGVIGVGVDVTRLTDLERQLATASRLESVGRLAAGLAHEINTPIQVLSTNAHFVAETTNEILAGLKAMHRLCSDPAFDGDAMRGLVEGLDVDFLESEIPKALQDTQHDLQRVAGLVRALKDFARGGQGIGPCRINDAVQSVVEISRHEWTQVADLQLGLDPGLDTIVCHEGQIKESLLAVIVNATQAVAEKREQFPGAPRGVIEVTTQAVPGAVQIVVRDTGIGMDDTVRRQIFDPFFTTKPVGRGSGQGLNLAYGAIVIHHGGSIDVTSAPGEGSTFTITLPTQMPGLEGPTVDADRAGTRP